MHFAKSYNNFAYMRNLAKLDACVSFILLNCATIPLCDPSTARFKLISDNTMLHPNTAQSLFYLMECHPQAQV